MSEFKAGRPIKVNDPALAELRAIMRSAGIEPEPNHHGTVDKVLDGEVLINFDDGAGAPYPVGDVHALQPREARS